MTFSSGTTLDGPGRCIGPNRLAARPHVGRRRLMTAETLNSYSAKDLAEMAKTRGVRGWHSMRKDQLIKAILKAVRDKANKTKAKVNGRAAAVPARLASSARPPISSRSV